MPDREKAIRILEGNYKSFVLRHNGELITVNELLALLKAQEPVKPIMRHVEFEYDTFGEWENKMYCPKCKMELLTRVNYCPKCGQAVKWGG